MRAAVFVSYRRDDSKHAAGRLGERVNERFRLFMDVDSISPGSDFTAVMRDAVQQADVLIAVIGTSWLTVTDEHGLRRLDRPDDWVAVEISTALQRGIPVIPVLVDGARMPLREELPAWLASLANRQAIRLNHESFAADCSRLIDVVERSLGADEGKDDGEGDGDLWADPDYPSARSALLQGQWARGIEGLERVLRHHPRNRTIIAQLEEAKSKQRIFELAERADRASADRRWAVAVDALESIAALQPTQDVAERLAEAKRRLQVATLQQDLRALAEGGHWDGVLAADAELAALGPDLGDYRGLATLAREHVTEARAEAEYLRGLRQLDSEQWSDAAATFEALLATRPGYRDAASLQALARGQLASDDSDATAVPPPQEADATHDVVAQAPPLAPVGPERTPPTEPGGRPPGDGPPGRNLRRVVIAAVAGAVLVVVGTVFALTRPSEGGSEDSSSTTTTSPSPAASSSATPPPSPAELLAASVPSGDWKMRYTYRYGVRSDGERTDADAWEPRTATWTFGTPTCTDSVCEGTVSSSGDADYPFTWDGKELTVVREPVYVYPKTACVSTSTGEAVDIDASAVVITNRSRFGSFAGTADRLHATVRIDVEYQVFGTCNVQPSTIVRRFEDQVLTRASAS